MPDMSPRAWAELGLLALVWGASFLAVRVALDEIGFLASVAWRVAPAALALWAVVLWRGLAVPRALSVWGALLVMGVLNNVVPFTLMAWGQLSIETGLVSILNAGTAVWGVLLAALFLADERLTPRRAAGVAIGFAGVATAIGFGSFAALDLRSLAQLAVVAGTVGYALAGVWARLHLRGLAPEVAAAGMLTGSTLVMLPVAALTEGLALPAAPATWAAIAYYALVATAFAYLLYFRVLAVAGSGNTMLVTLLVAPVAIVLGAVVRGETLGPHALGGFAVLALGLLVLDGRLLRRVAIPRARR
ncbi:DMT family transporter [Jannaschia sp. W003]|uniref:DMT family transporter n=1 Tax=Jannaschia sp. W003 TaxID=2867012 RepID=UPI0021A8A968|nr:DMT family transporter [Jannaschia sp. W003]UWQ20546.1 DMT family transporter [Jannaschia sp. W003]